ncbi:MAG: hypothetical protein OEL76_01370 [Siculibacillus sp.]|nr:hypothetical protein [Siculibacillus sp.]
MTTIAIRIAGAFLGLALLGSAALADPVGLYSVEGRGPEGNAYRGTATIEATGETYRVVWYVGSSKYVGTAVGNGEFFAVAYRSGNATGVAVYGKDGNDWLGAWTYSGGTAVGAEKLIRR